MNFYALAAVLKIPVNKLYEVYKSLFPNTKILDYSVGLTSKEIKMLKGELKNGK